VSFKILVETVFHPVIDEIEVPTTMNLRVLLESRDSKDRRIICIGMNVGGSIDFCQKSDREWLDIKRHMDYVPFFTSKH
jgi:hypothetical protein